MIGANVNNIRIEGRVKNFRFMFSTRGWVKYMAWILQFQK